MAVILSGAEVCYTLPMWPFSKRKKEEKPKSKIVRRLIVGFIIGGAISSIVGKKVLKDRRRMHLGEDNQE